MHHRLGNTRLLAIGQLVSSVTECFLYACEKDSYGLWHLKTNGGGHIAQIGSCLIIGDLQLHCDASADLGYRDWYPVLKEDKVLAMPARWLRFHDEFIADES